MCLSPVGLCSALLFPSKLGGGGGGGWRRRVPGGGGGGGEAGEAGD